MSFSFFSSWGFVWRLVFSSTYNTKNCSAVFERKKCHVQRSGKQLVREINCSATTDVVAKTYPLGDWSAFFVFVNTKSAVLTD